MKYILTIIGIIWILLSTLLISINFSIVSSSVTVSTARVYGLIISIIGFINGYFFLKVGFNYDKRKIFRFLSDLLKKMLIKNNFKMTVFNFQSESKIKDRIFDKFIDFRFSMRETNLKISETGIITYNNKTKEVR
ncbi:MAG: hypothetical protein N2319_08045 [Candidatus Kapabacteria bacterium]|nr:hypothetical protein [Candidatus Kapabacteria bacterium]